VPPANAGADCRFKSATSDWMRGSTDEVSWYTSAFSEAICASSVPSRALSSSIRRLSPLRPRLCALCSSWNHPKCVTPSASVDAKTAAFARGSDTLEAARWQDLRAAAAGLRTHVVTVVVSPVDLHSPITSAFAAVVAGALPLVDRVRDRSSAGAQAEAAKANLMLVVRAGRDGTRVAAIPAVMPSPVLDVPHALGREPDHVDLLGAPVVHLRICRRGRCGSRSPAAAPAAARRWTARLRRLHLQPNSVSCRGGRGHAGAGRPGGYQGPACGSAADVT